jgi:hypothetical protein
MNAVTALDLVHQQSFQTAKVKLPSFHRAQAKLRWVMHHNRFVVARCGRRWGKNVLGESVGVDDAVHGRLVGWFAPENKRLRASFDVMKSLVEPALSRASKNEDIIETITGGKIEFWSLEDEDAGRSRGYDRVIIDEAAFTKPKTVEVWKKSIRPTLVDRRGRALIMSNTKGIDPDNFLYNLCHDPKLGFVQFHAPSRSNPTLHPDEVASFEKDNEPLVYQQEFLAEFVDWSGAAFFALNKMLVNGQPVEQPIRCEAVFTVIDSATKTGKKNDGTGKIDFALIRHALSPVSADGRILPRYSLVILDWDLVQIEGALLEQWLPGVIEIGKDLANRCRAANGYLGAFIEDKASGMILLQQAQRRSLPAIPIDSKLTSVGKDERAISVSGYVYRELVKMSRHAFEKVVNYKGTTRNHLRGQVVGFRVGNPDPHASDDLVDCWCYGIAIALGNTEGF